MNITVYLPDALGQRAKNEKTKIEFSRLLQGAVENELKRRHAVSTTMENTQTHELDVETKNGSITGRIVGSLIAESHDVQVYLTQDKRVIAYDTNRLRYEELDDPESQLPNVFPHDIGAYIAACEALGIKAVVDL